MSLDATERQRHASEIEQILGDGPVGHRRGLQRALDRPRLAGAGHRPPGRRCRRRPAHLLDGRPASADRHDLGSGRLAGDTGLTPRNTARIGPRCSHRSPTGDRRCGGLRSVAGLERWIPTKSPRGRRGRGRCRRASRSASRRFHRACCCPTEEPSPTGSPSSTPSSCRTPCRPAGSCSPPTTAARTTCSRSSTTVSSRGGPEPVTAGRRRSWPWGWVPKPSGAGR